MKKFLFKPFILLLVVVITLSSSGLPIVFAEDKVDPNENPQGQHLAYCNFYGDLTSRNMSFIDGISLGIKERSDPYFCELVTLGGLEARRQYSGNSAFLKLDKDFYDEGDNEFLVNIYYYNFGPSEGKYYFEYKTESSTLNQITVYKPASPVGWRYASVVLTDCVPTPHYENGATFRIQNSAYNAWRRIEVVNLSRIRREGKSIEGIKELAHLKIRDLNLSGIVSADDPLFQPKNAANQVNKYDLYEVIARYTMDKTSIPEHYKNEYVTQSEMLKAFMDVVNVDYSSATSIVDFALESEFIDRDGLFTADNAPATYYNMITAIDGLVYYSDETGEPYVVKMYNNGYYGDLKITDINDDALLSSYFKVPRSLPYERITDNVTGRTYYHVNFYGKDLIRGYVTQLDWIGNNRFICTTRGGHLYLYNVDEQTIRYIDKSGIYGAQVGEDGMIYYNGPKDGAMNTLARIDPDDPTLTPKIVYRFPEGVRVSLIIISEDGKWFGGHTADDARALGTPIGYHPIATFYTNENSQPGVADTNYKVAFLPPLDEQLGSYGHEQANPRYDNLFFFCLEGGASSFQYKYTHANTRVNILNLDTGKIIGVNQGMIKDSMGIELNTHDIWSPDGEYIYYVFWQEVPAGFNGSEGSSRQGGMIRTDIDGRHRQYFNSTGYLAKWNHGNVGGDNMEWISGDAFAICAMNTDTHQSFEIASYQNLPGIVTSDQYDHGHTGMTRVGAIISWGGRHDGVLGVNWFDLEELVRNGEVAEGGRYDVNEYVECVSYKGLECDSERITKDGRDCQMAKATGGIYYAINTDIVDTTDDSIRITFDYLDNSKDDISITYTKGVKEYNELLFRENAKVSVSRNGTGKWKTATVIIDSINCESPGKFYSDLAFRGGSANLFISNIKVEKIETGREPKQFYNRWEYVEKVEK